MQTAGQSSAVLGEIHNPVIQSRGGSSGRLASPASGLDKKAYL
jgi:hypothetical protein